MDERDGKKWCVCRLRAPQAPKNLLRSPLAVRSAALAVRELMFECRARSSTGTTEHCTTLATDWADHER
jgi:hypothetical protein